MHICVVECTRHSVDLSSQLADLLLIRCCTGGKLSSSERALVSIARALLSSVDMLLLANTMDQFGTNTRERVVKVLKEMISNRGMAYDLTNAASLGTRCVSIATACLLLEIETHRVPNEAAFVVSCCRLCGALSACVQETQDCPVHHAQPSSGRAGGRLHWFQSIRPCAGRNR